MDHMNNGDLNDYIKAYMEIGKPIPQEEVLELFYQCAAGLYYCHKNMGSEWFFKAVLCLII